MEWGGGSARYRRFAERVIVGRNDRGEGFLMAFGFRKTCGLLAAAAMVLAPPASAQPTPIPLGENATWKSEEATLEMPPELAGFRRDGIVDVGDQRLDVVATYRDRTPGTAATLYLYRAPLADAALWHDRALAGIRPHPTLGTPDPTAAATEAFVPPRHDGVASGLRTVMPLRGTGFRSTGLAIFALDEWLVKVRMTSQVLDAAQLTARLSAFVEALAYEAPVAPQPVAVMADCSGVVRFENASRADPPNVATQIVASTFGNLTLDRQGDESEGARPAALRFCRDAATTADIGIYRPNGSEIAYIMTFGDAGVSASVQQLPAAELLAGPGGQDFWISLSTIYETATFRGFRALPRPEQVLQVLQAERPVTRSTRGVDGKPTVSISVDRAE